MIQDYGCRRVGLTTKPAALLAEAGGDPDPHDAAAVADAVVVSTAVKADNPEVVAARERKIPVVPRAEMLAEYFVHGLGHGIGLNVHEAPLLGASSAGTLEESVPFTVEPGVYIPGKGGVRIEDTCVIQPDGLEILTEFPRKLLRVG